MPSGSYPGFVADESPLDHEPEVLVFHKGDEGNGCDSALPTSDGDLDPVGVLHEFGSARAAVVRPDVEVLAMVFDISQDA